MTPTWQELSTEPTRQVGVYEYNAQQLRHAKSVKISTSVLSALGQKVPKKQKRALESVKIQKTPKISVKGLFGQ